MGIIFYIVSDRIVLGIVHFGQHIVTAIQNNGGKVPIEGILKHVVPKECCKDDFSTEFASTRM